MSETFKRMSELIRSSMAMRGFRESPAIRHEGMVYLANPWAVARCEDVKNLSCGKNDGIPRLFDDWPAETRWRVAPSWPAMVFPNVTCPDCLGTGVHTCKECGQSRSCRSCVGRGRVSTHRHKCLSCEADVPEPVRVGAVDLAWVVWRAIDGLIMADWLPRDAGSVWFRSEVNAIEGFVRGAPMEDEG